MPLLKQNGDYVSAAGFWESNSQSNPLFFDDSGDSDYAALRVCRGTRGATPLIVDYYFISI
jgi:hypothetical protein